MNKPTPSAKGSADSLKDDAELFCFSSGLYLNTLFAGKLQERLKKIEQVFAVTLIQRDAEIAISAPNKRSVQKVKTVFEKLIETQQQLLRAPDGNEFETILRSIALNEGARLQAFFAERITVSPRKRDVVPRTPAQLGYVRQLREKPIVFGIGPAGTGKTYLAMAMAVNALLSGAVQRIVLTRPAREAGENLGFLPGTLEEKIMPYLRPLYDALYEMMTPDEINTLIEKKAIEIAPLAFMRGRTLNEAFIILDEAQNATADQMFMFLTRMGFDSKCVVTGDPQQTDLPQSAGPGGLETAARRLQKIDEIGFTRFETKDVVRHTLVEKIIRAWNQDAPAMEKKG